MNIPDKIKFEWYGLRVGKDENWALSLKISIDFDFNEVLFWPGHLESISYAVNKSLLSFFCVTKFMKFYSMYKILSFSCSCITPFVCIIIYIIILKLKTFVCPLFTLCCKVLHVLLLYSKWFIIKVEKTYQSRVLFFCFTEETST